ncbi:MAG: GNAT family N-acetyltransferase [Paracoccus sp. (in: a-proteobacteria)]|uniref:GNAT family N-acetyltransferase n=1 Tax=Paracoccus sp. TaxID=267 RepID=UPI0026E0AEF0|nr:GNAT family N-acetyltransferase [Paracoccus sp. (in: a-proteobacteria)]MDO5621170.1 GNAT family N-acetyltransferase [Paracoccus sp. (in: a-proteobacteria)]
MDAALAAAFDATWPAAEYARIGGFRLGRALGGGRRVGSAVASGPWDGDQVQAVMAQAQAWDQPALFRVDDEDEPLRDALLDRGLVQIEPSLILTVPVAALTDLPVPPITAFPVWPMLAIQRDLFAESGIGPGRLAVMDRTPAPKAALLGRTDDRAAGVGFAAIHGDTAMLHALNVLPAWREKGLAAWMVREAAFWAADQGAASLAVAVTRNNATARRLYHRLGFQPVAGYVYLGKPA